MQLNKTEQRFLLDVLRVELDVPIRADLKVYDSEFPVLVIPQITQNGFFELRYFGTPFLPAEVGPDGSQSWTDYDIFGIHPAIEKSWKNRDNVILELVERPHPFVPRHNTSGPRICAKILSVDDNNKGILAIHENQVTVAKSPLRKAKFSLVDFPEIIHRRKHRMQDLNARKELNDSHDELQTEYSRVENKSFFSHSRFQNITNLITESGWEITLIEDDELTRGNNSYTGTIEREDGEEFDIKQLRQVLEGLTKFFSFTTCALRHPTAVIALCADDRVAWGQVGRFKLMPQNVNWFLNSESIAENALLEYLFPEFWSKWEKDRDAFAAVIDYYVSGSALQQMGFPRNAVETTYAGLELLAHLILASPHKRESVSNIEKAIKQHGIPHLFLDESETPISFQVAQKLNAQQSGVDLINKVRNYVAHPIDFDNDIIKQDPLQHLDKDYHPYFNIHDLGQFYLEYLLLKEMCDYAPRHHRPLDEQLSIS